MERDDYCRLCRKKFSRSKKISPCDKCKNSPPSILPENIEAFELWRHIATQWRVGIGGLVGLDYMAAFAVAAVLEIAMTPEMLLKIRILEYKTLDKIYKKGG